VTSVAETLAQGTALLRDSSDSPHADAMLLLAHALNRGREWIVAHGDATPSLRGDRSIPTSQHASARAACRLPICWEAPAFTGASSWLTKASWSRARRPSTSSKKHFALSAIARCRFSTSAPAPAQSRARSPPKRQATVHGTDISPAAIAIAKENARRLGVADRCTFHAGDLTDPVGAQRFDVVVANLPYVPTRRIAEKPDPVAYEPRVALDGGPDGLALYRRLLGTLRAAPEPKRSNSVGSRAGDDAGPLQRS
jgi:hypothetical protein